MVGVLLGKCRSLEELAPARRLLDDAGVPGDCLVKAGRGAPTIASVARALGCDRVSFGDEPAGIAERLFGTPAEQVRHLLKPQGDPGIPGCRAAARRRRA